MTSTIRNLVLKEQDVMHNYEQASQNIKEGECRRPFKAQVSQGDMHDKLSNA